MIGQAWPELLGVLFNASQSADAGQREVAFRIFATTPGIIQKQHEEAVQNVFAKGFKDEDVDVCPSTVCRSFPTNVLVGADIGRSGFYLILRRPGEEVPEKILWSSGRHFKYTAST